MSILLFLLALGILVATHEWGHFIVAKKSGVGVEIFSIGFGPRLISFKRAETEYRFSLIPLGGYVKLVGEDPADETADVSKSFSKKPVWARLATVLAGPAMNILVTMILLPIVFLVGRYEVALLKQAPVVIGTLSQSPAELAGLEPGDRVLSVASIATPSWDILLQTVALREGDTVNVAIDRHGEAIDKKIKLIPNPYESSRIGFLGVEPMYLIETIVGEVKAGMPGEAAGLIPGDRIIDINGKPVQWWVELVGELSKLGGQELELGIARGGEERRLRVKPVLNPNAEVSGQAWLVGISPQLKKTEMVLARYGLGDALSRSVAEMKNLTHLTIETLKRLFSFNLSYKALSGPVGIAAAGGQAASMGFGNFLYFLAFLSLNLGVLNLLPIPLLDGGHVAFMAIEGVIRREIPPRIKGMIQTVFLVLLLGLMLLVTVNDLDSLFGFKALYAKILGWF